MAPGIKKSCNILVDNIFVKVRESFSHIYGYIPWKDNDDQDQYSQPCLFCDDKRKPFFNNQIYAYCRNREGHCERAFCHKSKTEEYKKEKIISESPSVVIPVKKKKTSRCEDGEDHVDLQISRLPVKKR